MFDMSFSYFLNACGSKVPSLSLGMFKSIFPYDDLTVFLLVPFLVFKDSGFSPYS